MTQDVKPETDEISEATMWASEGGQPTQKEWTLMFYFASDNPLAPTIVSQLKAIKDAGFHSDANVIAQFDPHTVNVPTHTFEVNIVNKLRAGGKSKVGFGANDPFVRNLVLDRLWGENEESTRKHMKQYVETATDDRNDFPNLDEEDLASKPRIVYDPPRPSAAMSGEQNPKKALTSFLDFCRQSYPARHYMLFILGHGLVVGNDSFLFDDHSVEHSLLLTDLGEVLRTFNCNIHNDESPGELEMVGFHSCSMSGLEVAYELKGAAKYMLASQGPAFVGSWPYRQILLRVFNDLNSCQIKAWELQHTNRLASRLKGAADPISSYLFSRFADKTKELLTQYHDSTPPTRLLLYALLHEFNSLLEDPELPQNEQFREVQLAEETKQLLAQHPRGTDAKWLNRMLLSDAYPEIRKKEKPNVKDMLTKIFYYCLYNSYDFQLAGYSFDLCLSDLSKVPQVTDPLKTLAKSLTDGLRDKTSLAKELILLAHWDSQSFWQEDYADLYDFCFRLQTRCKETNPDIEMRPNTDTLKKIYDACDEVTEALRRGSNTITDKVIVRSAFAGPAFQYCHGLSIFFPWAEPVGSKLWDEQYAQYTLNKKSSWRDFLKTYFKLTRRLTHVEEGDPKEPAAVPAHMSDELLGLLEEVSARIFNDEGQLGKYGPDDPLTIKYGPDDPAGGSCDCPTIKNYPLFTRARENETEKGKTPGFPISPDFFGLGFLK